ncbi:hypothetical protein BDW59DRAFT_133074 [Aspergillus cavernicola]|uniref:Mis18 domain-containing protein n=1 Tax=Aspergillus cavernicola TaxID=176166 RepID=A0ABR4HPN2_9EURO
MPSSTMDLSKLTRPAVLCQCSRCSSSLAALENEWAKLSNSYSVAAGWFSIELHRISISSEMKQIPQSSELNLIRGRIIQEIGCKLCQQKLGVLCALDNGPNIFWKLSKVSFREIVTMRTVEATFKEGDEVLETLLFPKPKELGLRLDGAPAYPGALVPTGSNKIDNYGSSVEQQIQQQGLSLDHISSSVTNLHDTMHELKNAFTSMRIELNGPSRFSNEQELSNGSFDMVTTVLKELKSKSDEIEKLKLEIEALKLRNRYVEEQTARKTLPSLTVEPLPEVGTPGLLQGSRKRAFPFPEHYQGVRRNPVADSFDDEDEEDEDSMANFSLGETRIPSVKIPLRDSVPTVEQAHVPTASRSPRLLIEADHLGHQTPQSLSLDDPVAKRPRPSSSGNSSANRRGRGRPSRKSISQTTQPNISHTPNSSLLNEQNTKVGTNSHTDQRSSTPTEHRNSIENRPTHPRTLRSRSRPPSPNSRIRMSTEQHNEQNTDQTQNPNEMAEPTSQLVVDLGKENSSKGNKHETNEQRKAQTAARNIMAKLAMQREEAMDTEEAR